MTDVWLLVLKDMEERRLIGIERYGVPVTGDDGTDWMQHLYEELLDAAVYIRAVIERRKRWSTLEQ